MYEDVSVYFCLYMFFFFLEENASCSFFCVSGVTIDLGCPRKSQFTPVCVRSPFTCRTLQFNWWIIWSHYPFISPFHRETFPNSSTLLCQLFSLHAFANAMWLPPPYLSPEMVLARVPRFPRLPDLLDTFSLYKFWPLTLRTVFLSSAFFFF